MYSKRYTSPSSPQLAIREQSDIAVVLSQKQTYSLYKKAESSDIPFDILKEVYQRGYKLNSSEKEGFNRVNSFISNGAAMKLDEDLYQKYTGAEKVSSNPAEPSNRFVGTNSLVDNYKKATPGQRTVIKTIKKVVKENIMENVQIQTQDLAGNWRTINMVSNQPQQILQRMQQVKLVNPKFRVRAIDSAGKLIDILP